MKKGMREKAMEAYRYLSDKVSKEGKSPGRTTVTEHKTWDEFAKASVQKPSKMQRREEQAAKNRANPKAADAFFGPPQKAEEPRAKQASAHAEKAHKAAKAGASPKKAPASRVAAKNLSTSGFKLAPGSGRSGIDMKRDHPGHPQAYTPEDKAKMAKRKMAEFDKKQGVKKAATSAPSVSGNVMTGPRGGRYYMSGGKKCYVAKGAKAGKGKKK